MDACDRYRTRESGPRKRGVTAATAPVAPGGDRCGTHLGPMCDRGGTHEGGSESLPRLVHPRSLSSPRARSSWERGIRASRTIPRLAPYVSRDEGAGGQGPFQVGAPTVRSARCAAGGSTWVPPALVWRPRSRPKRACDLTCHSVQLGGLRWIGRRALP